MSDKRPEDEVALTPEQAFSALDQLLTLARHYAELLNMHDGGARDLPDTVRGWVDRLGEKGHLPSRPAPTLGFMVESMVSSRDKKPYVRISDNEGRFLGQLSPSTVRELALNFFNAAAAAEGDALLGHFCEKMEFPPQATGFLIQQLRQLRDEWEEEEKT